MDTSSQDAAQSGHALASAPRRKPRQKRAEQTIARILDSAAELLEELGLDRLNTNLICQRAGLTPPALYRYFPNKYAVLKALGERLMEAQNEALLEMVQEDQHAQPTAERIAAVLMRQFEVTIEQKGAGWIMRALHATPQLAEVRTSSHLAVTQYFVAQQLAIRPATDRAQLERHARIVVEAGYALLEMLIDHPEMDPAAVFQDAGHMILSLLNAPSAINQNPL